MNKTFSIRNRKRCESSTGFNHPLSSWSASDWMVAVVGELGEAANNLKKLNRYRDGVRGNKDTKEVLKAKLEQEIADTYIYLDLFCQSQGINLESAVFKAFDNKSREIGYEEEF